MINEERICAACLLPIQDMRKAALVPDQGTGQVYHRHCLEAMVGETPTHDDEVRQSVIMPIPQPWIHIKPALPEPAVKADVPVFSPDQCALCHRAISGDQGVVRSGLSVAHSRCVQVLLDFVNRPELARPAVKASLEDGERLAKEDARYLVQTLAAWLRVQETE